MKAADGGREVLHLAAASDRSFPASFMNCVVTTRNLLDAVVNSAAFAALLTSARLPYIRMQALRVEEYSTKDRTWIAGFWIGL